jgi:Uma2 family endonuclease
MVAIEFEDKVTVTSLATFREWAKSDAYPERGQFSYLAGSLYVDLSMEKFIPHNQVKGEFAVVLGQLVKTAEMGYYVHDNMLYTNVGADLSTEPDGAFLSYDTMREGRAWLNGGALGDDVELEGVLDMVLEVVSDSSVRKDTVRLHDLYWRAGIPEYWLVDARGAAPQFTIFKHGPEGYTRTRPQKGGWLKSDVFGRSFRLTQNTDLLGHPRCNLAVR